MLGYRRITFYNPFAGYKQTRWAQEGPTADTYRILDQAGGWTGKTVTFQPAGIVSKVETTQEDLSVRVTFYLRPEHLLSTQPAVMDLHYGELEVAK